VLQHLNAINQKKADHKTGTVTIEDMGQAPDETVATDQVDKDSRQP
jgi:hypothetical protein